MSYNYPTTKDSSHNEIKVPMNTKNICGVDCYEQNGVAYLRLENVARGLGFTRIAASGNEVVRWERVEQYLRDIGFCRKLQKPAYPLVGTTILSQKTSSTA